MGSRTRSGGGPVAQGKAQDEQEPRLAPAASGVALVTGSSHGIGRETALRFASERWRVVVTFSRDAKEAEAVGRECLREGAPGVLVRRLDVTEAESVRSCVAAAVDRFGHIDVLVNNAGVVFPGPFAHQEGEEIAQQIRVNLEGLIQMTRAALPHVRRAILNVGSGAAYEGFENLATYSATKFGVRGFTQALAQELADVRVLAVHPWYTATRMTGFHGASPGDVARIIVDTALGRLGVPTGGEVDVRDHV